MSWEKQTRTESNIVRAIN